MERQEMGKPIIRVTQLEQFRKWLTDRYSYITEQSVIDSITGEFQGNAKTFVGTVFHKIVEEGTPECEKTVNGRIFHIGENNITIGVQACKEALRYRNLYPQAFHEIRLYKDYGPAFVTGQADLVDGTEIHDIKTRFSPIREDSDYSDSCQWKFYCEMFKADRFQFDIFLFDGWDDQMAYQYAWEDAWYVDVRNCSVQPYDPPIVCYPYPGMHEDNERLLKDFLAWAEEKGITEHLNFRE